ncbi:MAG: phosphoribosylglycinamide formyltransferase [Chitinophagaceae bacterium]|nr:phosphoribosylglycinamide formyltransferase [Chitinophagaceae bacterium]
MNSLAIFASGAGSNAQKIIERFQSHDAIKVALVVSNKSNAGVLNIAEKAAIPTMLIERDQFFRGDGYIPSLKEYKIDWIILAGFLWKVPDMLINAYRGKIINIHPALLPNYGGKGMYGDFVHEAVIAAKENRSGITIHFVDEHYDHGDIIFQAHCDINESDNAALLASKIHRLEHEHFGRVIEETILGGSGIK